MNLPRLFNVLRKRYNLRSIFLGLVAYLLILGLYMQPVITNGCNATYLGGPGDQSAFAWLYMASPEGGPLWGQTAWTNAPYGENVSEPFYITGLAQYAAVWAIEKVVGPTCAFNVYASFGFIFTATIMFLFILWLTKRRNYFVAWFGGYLFAFTPYLQLKTPHHVSYVYAGLLVLLLWLLLAYWRRPRVMLAGWFMLLLSLLFYHDPYFVMLGGFMLLSIGVGTVIYHAYYDKLKLIEWWRRLRPLLLMLPIFVVLISPVVYVRFAQSDHISTVVEQSRDNNIMDEGRAYGARPREYILPAATNPLTPSWLKDFQLKHQHGATITETTLFLGYVPLVLASIYTIHWLRTMRHRKNREARGLHHTAIVAACMAVIGGFMSLPPYVHIGSWTIYLPSWILLSITSMWRVPARLVVVVQMGLVILAVLGLLYLIDRYKARLRGARIYIAYGLLLVVSLCEYASINPFSRDYWTYSMTPHVYSEIKSEPGVDMIVEYPIVEPPRNDAFVYYLTYQSYHQKSMINTAKTGSQNKQYRESLTDISDWQTAGVLKQLGVDRVLVHHDSAKSLPLAPLVQIGDSYDTQQRLSVSSYRIAEAVAAKPYAVTIADGFDGPSSYGFSDIDFYMHQSGTLRPVLLPGATKQAKAILRIEYYAFEKAPRRVALFQNGTTVATIAARQAKQVVELAIDPQKPISIVPDDPPADYSFVISNMEINQYSH